MPFTFVREKMVGCVNLVCFLFVQKTRFVADSSWTNISLNLTNVVMVLVVFPRQQSWKQNSWHLWIETSQNQQWYRCMQNKGREIPSKFLAQILGPLSLYSGNIRHASRHMCIGPVLITTALVLHIYTSNLQTHLGLPSTEYAMGHDRFGATGLKTRDWHFQHTFLWRTECLELDNVLDAGSWNAWYSVKIS